MSFPQIRVQSLHHTQIHVLPKPCPLKSVSSDVTPRSMSLQKHISSDLCPLMSYSELCLQNICSLSSVPSDIIHRSRTYVKRNIPTDLCLPHFGQRGKKHLLPLTARFTSGIPTD